MHSSLAFLTKRNTNTEDHKTEEPDADNRLASNSAEGINSKSNTMDLHFNLWDVSTSQRSKSCFLDVGIRVNKIDEIEDLLVYFPFSISREDFIDLHSCFSTNSELVRTIFNENLSFESVTQNLSFVRFDNKSKDNKFFIHETPFSNESLISINHGNFFYNGDKLDSTLLSFKGEFIKNLKKYHENQKHLGRDSTDAYFRFRVPLEKRNVFIEQYKQGSGLITGSLSKSEIVDFRVNEVRSLPAQLYQEKDIRDLNFASCRVDYFLVKDAKCEYQTSHGSFKKSRTLEKSFWKDYLLYESKNSNLKKVLEEKEPMVIYHWNKIKDIGDEFIGFSAFSKFVEPRVHLMKVVTYIAMIILLAILANIATSHLESYFPALFGDQNINCDKQECLTNGRER
ncbi:hypothetical protein [Vibrio cholerae]|uniref:hypothetical protein n=1 Tax=Vibrio cholerae TaxID=666 RepID=UPI001C2F99BB